MQVIEKLPPLVASPDIDIEVWLDEQTRVQPAVPLLWDRGTGETQIRSVEHLSVLLSSLGDGDFASVHWPDYAPPRWAQTMHVDDGLWIVEASLGDDSFVERVFRGGPGDYPPRADGDVDLHPFEKFPPLVVASVIWAWEHGSLPEGYARTLNYLSPQDRRRWGFDD